MEVKQNIIKATKDKLKLHAHVHKKICNRLTKTINDWSPNGKRRKSTQKFN